MSNTFNTEKKLNIKNAVRKELVDQTVEAPVNLSDLAPFNTVTVSSLNIDQIKSLHHNLKES